MQPRDDRTADSAVFAAMVTPPDAGASRRPKAKTQAKPLAKKTRKSAPRKKTPAKAVRQPPLVVNGLMLISVHGPFNSRALVEMSAERALELFEQPLSSALSPIHVIDATMAEITELAARAPNLGLDESAMAASALALAYEIQNPFNSATSKSMCAHELRETMSKLRDLAPARDEDDGIDDLSTRRAARLAKPARPAKPARRAAT